MNKFIATIGAALLVSGAAFAQTTVTTTVTPEQQAKVKTYVMKEKKPSLKVTEQVTVGSTLPSSVEFYSLPSDVGVTNYRYTVVNDRTVLVDPASRKIIQIIE